MNIFFRLAAVLLATLATGTQAENADQTMPESTPASVETRIEAPTETTEENASREPVKPEEKAASDKASQNRVFLPSENISEDIVVTFPVDI